jgi:hypothetical protein
MSNLYIHIIPTSRVIEALLLNFFKPMAYNIFSNESSGYHLSRHGGNNCSATVSHHVCVMHFYNYLYVLLRSVHDARSARQSQQHWPV